MGSPKHHVIPASCGTLAGGLRLEILTGVRASAMAYTRRMEVDRVDAVYGVDTGGQGWKASLVLPPLFGVLYSDKRIFIIIN